MLFVLPAHQRNFDCCFPISLTHHSYSFTPFAISLSLFLSLQLSFIRLMCHTLTDTRTRCPYNTHSCIARHILNHLICDIFYTYNVIRMEVFYFIQLFVLSRFLFLFLFNFSSIVSSILLNFFVFLHTHQLFVLFATTAASADVNAFGVFQAISYGRRYSFFFVHLANPL